MISCATVLIPSRADSRCLCRLLLAIAVVLGCAGADGGEAREQRLAERLIATVETGEPVQLRTDRGEFLALHDAALGALPRHAVVLVHNMGGHPDWPEVIEPLRTSLPDRGWSTLSLQMPLLASQALADDYGRTIRAAVHRIESGVEFLREQQYSCIVLIGYSFGASQALAYLAKGGAADGLVTIGILAREFLQPAVDLPSLLGRVDIPVLDIYGRNDFPEVVNRAHDRRNAVSGQDKRYYEQRVIDGADHYFTEREQQLIDVVEAWLDTTFSERPCGPDDIQPGEGRIAEQATGQDN